MAADFPYNTVTAQSTNDDYQAFIDLHIQSEFFPIDVDALTAVVQQWLVENVPEIISTTAVRHERVFTNTPLPPIAR